MEDGTQSNSSVQAASNVAYLKTQVESWLAVFFNVFGSVGRDHRNVVGEVISAWASIAGELVGSPSGLSLLRCLPHTRGNNESLR
jgi:hypothetical protein